MDLSKTKKTIDVNGKSVTYFSLPELESQGIGNISRLPVSIKIVLEALLRNVDGKVVTEDDVKTLANWNAKSPAQEEIPFKPARVVAQDFTGVPLLVDLAAMRDAVKNLGGDPKIIEPLVNVDLVVDHSVQVDSFGKDNSLDENVRIEFERNKERYQFLKWGQQAFEKFSVVPPSVGIIHQVNLEYLAEGVLSNEEGVAYPDSLVGTDSHTTMINGLGVVGWGVGGIEAEAAMLGQPVYFLTPEVIGVHLKGRLKEGVTATDLVLTVTEKLREKKVVGKFVEFYGEGVENLSLADRATIANMCPEYGATMGFFPSDEETIRYMKQTGRSDETVALAEAYLKAQNLFGIPKDGEVDYSDVLTIELESIEPSIAGPRRPQDRINLSDVKGKFKSLLTQPVKDGGFGLSKNGEHNPEELGNGSVVIAAITSCTNTSNPSVMLAAGLLAKKAVEKGLKVKPFVKTSLGPGSRVVTDYLEGTGLLPYLEELGFNVVGYGCTTCIGNSGPLPEEVGSKILSENLVTASVLSGNRNFEARVHRDVKASFLMSPPLVVAYALAGHMEVDLEKDAIGKDKEGNDVHLKDLWPTHQEIADLIESSMSSEKFKSIYAKMDSQTPDWEKIQSSTGVQYDWDPKSTYIQNPPFFEGFSLEPSPKRDIKDAKILALLKDSVTTDHISPAGAIAEESPAGKYLKENGVEKANFNTYGSRRGNDRIMTRGTFANNRIKNQMLDGVEGGYTKIAGNQAFIFDAAESYKKNETPLIVFAGKEYGTGSSRDWAAKGTKLLGVKAVVAESFERIHRSNLIGMGVLPLQFKDGENWSTLGLTGDETINLIGIESDLKPRKTIQLEITKPSGETSTTDLLCRIDTPIEVDYYQHGGILDYVIRGLIKA